MLLKSCSVYRFRGNCATPVYGSEVGRYEHHAEGLEVCLFVTQRRSARRNGFLQHNGCAQ